MNRIRIMETPPVNLLGQNAEDFLRKLGGPVCLVLKGHDTTRSRALVTLLHGNEPSGLRALHRWLKSGRRPAVNTLCIVASVEAALAEPVFSHRVMPGKRDLNRCFRAPFNDEQGQLAASILEILNEHQAEAVVDMHNTSGSGPGFCVSVSVDDKHRALVSLFSQRLVTNDLRIGALMEIAEHLHPAITVECGGRLDKEADSFAWNGLQRFMDTDDLFAPAKALRTIEIFHNPVRLELVNDCRLCYADGPDSRYDLVLSPDLERLNYGTVAANTRLGWVGERGREVFLSRNIHDDCVLGDIIRVEDGAVYTVQDLKLFMVTVNPDIALMDCLFYAVKDDGRAIGSIEEAALVSD